MYSKTLTKEEVLKISRLARLQLTDDQVELYRTRLLRVLDYIHELNAFKTPEDAFVRHVPKDAVAFREDQSIQFLASHLFIENAPEKKDECFLLPTIVEQS